MSRTAKQTARDARSSTPLRLLARGGYAANGVAHIIIGAIVLVIAAGGPGESDQAGAFKAIAQAPWGFAALWAMALLLGGLGLWHAAEGVAVMRRSDLAKWGVRISEWGQALIFVALGVIAASVALGARPDADETAQDASRGVLTVPGGPWVLALIGLAIAGGGVAFVVMGVRRSFHDKVSVPDGPLGTAITVLGVVGFLAKGVALGVVGVLLLVAAVTVDAQTAGGIDGAIRALLDVFGGPFLVAAVGTGFIAYGVFCLFRARYARL
jgi:hypothetical protein